jgi:DnaJ-class molecular chaperone
LARQYHPDVNPNDKKSEERFKEVNEANDVLSDPEKRKKYDEMLSYYQQYGQWPGAAGASDYSGASNFGGFGGGDYRYQTLNEEDFADLFGDASPFSDFFETFFHSTGTAQRGGRATSSRGRSTRAQSYAMPGQDVESTVEVSLAEAYQGATRTFTLTEPNGTTRRLEIKIPAGVDEGSRIRVAGQGSSGSPASAGRGDLILIVHIIPDPRFTREGATLRTTVDVVLADAMLGGEVAVPTPDGRRLMLRIPPETQNGKVFRLRGQGMPLQVGQTDQRGDLYATVSVVLPTGLTPEQRRLFEAFARSLAWIDRR